MPFLRSLSFHRTCRHMLRSKSLSTSSVGQQRPASNCPYSVEEISIPNGHQYDYTIACKVWRGDGEPSKDPEPPILCVHGWLDNAASFDPLLPLLMRPGRVFYAFDLPGHGLSSHIHTTHYNNHTEAHLSIHRVVRHLKLQRFSLLGHSMGAEGAVMYAGSFPDGVHKMVTLDGVVPSPPNWLQSTQAFVHGLFEVDALLEKSPQPEPSSYEDLLARMLKARRSPSDTVTEEGCRTLLQRGSREAGEGKFRFSHDLKLRLLPGMAMMTKEQFSEFCAVIPCPLLVIKARENDPNSRQASKEFQTAMEIALKHNPGMNVKFHEANGNHHIHLNEPLKVAQIISDFLNS